MILPLAITLFGLAVTAVQPPTLLHHHQGRVIGGTNAGTGSYPFAAFLMVNEGGGTSAFCGGTIIDHQWILTAGHCVVSSDDGGNTLVNHTRRTSARRRWPKKTKSGGYPVIDAKNIVVGVGNSNIDNMQTYRVTEVHVHPDLNLDYFDNDVAVLKLHSKLNFDTFVQPIRIDTNSIPDNMVVTGIGWGKTRLDQTVTSPILQQVDLVTGNENICAAIRPRFDNNDGNYICVPTPDGKDTCSGDSGGPLLRRCNGDLAATGIQGTGSWVQLGITSYGDNVQHSDEAVCAARDGAGFYTHAAKYLDFISGKTGISKKNLIADCNGNHIEYGGGDNAALGRAVSMWTTVSVGVIATFLLK